MATRPLSSHPRRFVRRNSSPLVFIGVGTAFLAIAVVLALNMGGNSTANPRVDFTLPTLDGSTFSLSGFRGQVVLVNFWASWCPPCRAEMPGLQDYYDEHRDHGLMLVAVNVGETPGTARAFVEANGFSFPVALDPDSRVADLYGVTGLPVTLVVDAEGRMVYQHTGLITRDVLDTQVVPLLGR